MASLALFPLLIGAEKAQATPAELMARGVSLICSNPAGETNTATIDWNADNTFFEGKGDIPRVFCEFGFTGEWTTYISDNYSGPARFYNGIDPNPAPSPSPSPTPSPSNTATEPANTNSVSGTVGEGGQLTLTAPAGNVFTSVAFANYGLPNNYTANPQCGRDVASQVSSIFLGNSTGSVRASNSISGDPCPGVGKRLSVTLNYSASAPEPSPTPTPSPTPEALTIGAPTNLSISEGATAITLRWNAPADGTRQPERYAISFNCSECNGWGIATGNVGDANALRTTITIDHSLLNSLRPAGTVWSFHIRSDNDTLRLYSANSNVVTGSTYVAPTPTPEPTPTPAHSPEPTPAPSPSGPTAEEIAAQAAAQLSAQMAEAARIQAEAAALIAQQAAAAQAEANRIAEILAAKAESERLAAEAAAKKAEEERIAAEIAKAKADEEARIAEEKRRQAEEDARIAEEKRLKAEAEAKAAEEARAKAELEAKIKSEQDAKKLAEQKAAEESKAKAEADKAKAEADAKAAEQEKLDRLAEEAKAGKELSKEEVAAVVTALVENLKPGESISAAQVEGSGVSYSQLPPSTPIEIRTSESGEVLVITAEVAANVELVQDPGALLEAVFTDPGAALAALGSIGADMTPGEREEATEMVVATVVAAGAAINAASAGSTGGSSSGNSSGGGSGGGGASGNSKGVRRRP